MYVNPGTTREFGQRLTHDLAERVSKSWSRVFLSGLLLIVAGVLIFSIDWSVRSLSTFIGVLFIAEGVFYALTPGLDARVRRTNVLTGLLSIGTGILIIAWPSPGLVALGVVLGAWLIVVGTIVIAGAFAARQFLPNWWLFLIEGLLAVPLGVLALANPGATLAALITVGGIYSVAIGVMRVVLSFEIKRLPKDVDKLFASAPANGNGSTAKPEAVAPAAS
ncbi:MAG TPA: DUF308 domain-containing protein [Thermoleophilaceae bacterium]